MSNKSKEQCHKAEAKENVESGTAFTIFGLVVLLALCLPRQAKHPGNLRLTASLLLSLATFLAGKALMLLSLNMMGLREDLVSGGQRVAVKCLRPACAFLSVATLVSLLALLPGTVYLYIGLAAVAVIMLSAAGAHWYLCRCTDGGGLDREAPASYGQELNDRDELEAAWRTSSCVTNSAFGGLVGILSSASKISAGTVPAAVGRAAYTAMFFMFSTAIVGMFVMTVSKKVPEITTRRCRQLHVATIKAANALLLCSLACAAFAAAFVVLRYSIFAAFAPLVITSVMNFLLRHCVAGRGGSMAANLRENKEAQIKAIEDIASKVMVITLGGIMTVLGGWLSEKDHAKWGTMDMFMVVLTSAFVSSFGFMVLAAAPGSARERLAPVARVLIWSTVALFATTAVAVYGVEVSGVDNAKP